VVSILVIAMQR